MIRQADTTGTGFFVLPGVVASCQHVVDAANPDKLRLLWRGRSLPVSSIIPSPRPSTLDLVLIKVDETNHPLLPIASADVAVGEVFSFGFQYTERGYSGYSVWGTLAGYAIDSSGSEPQRLLLIAEANVQPGASGAPLFSLEDGKVVGVVKRSNPDGGGYAVRIEELQDLRPNVLEDNLRLAPAHQFAQRALTRYMQQVQREHSYVTMVDLRRELRLEDIYVSLTIAPQSVTGAPMALGVAGTLSAAAEMGPLEKMDARTDMGGPQRQYRQAEVPLGELLSQRTAIILGEPGAGKTTLLRHLLLRTCLGETFVGRVPVFIKLASIKREPGCLSKFVTNAYPASAQAILEATEEGKAVYFVDGLDEIAKSDFEIVSDEVNRLAADQNVVFLSSRLASFPQGQFSSAFRVFECIGFNPTQQRRFLRQWFSHNPQLAVSLERQLRVNKGVAGFSRNPLLLSFLAIVFENDREFKLPVYRAELYSRMLDVLLRRRTGGAEPERLSRREKIQFLQHLAFDLMSDSKEVISDDDLLTRIESWLAAGANQRLRDLLPETVLAILVEKDGILANSSMNSFRFMHLTLQEYLAAKHLTEMEDWTEVVVSRSHDPRWEEVLRLMAGSLAAADADRLVSLLWSTHPPGKRKPSIQQRLLAARCASDSPQIAPATLRILTTELLQHAFGQGIEPVVNDAITTLASLCSTHPAGLNTVQEFFYRQYQSTPPLFVLFRYVQLLDLTASNASTKELLGLLGLCFEQAGRNEAETLLAGNILTGLGHSGDLTIIPQLTSLLGSQSSYMAASAATALIDLKDEHIEAALHDYQESGNDYVRVLTAAVSFRSSGVEAMRTMLKRVFCKRPDMILQLTACQTVDADSLEPDAGFVTGLVRDCAVDEDKARLLNLTWLLAFLDDTMFIELLIFDVRRPMMHRCSALEAFLQLQPWRAEEILVRLLEMRDTTLIRASLAVLGRSGNTGAHSALIRRIGISSEEWLLRATINLFSQTWAPSTWDWLIEVLDSSTPESDVHLLALTALAFQRNDSIIPYLHSYLDLWSAAHIRERITVYQALARLGTQAACDLVVSRLFRESDVAVITHAIEALGEMRSSRAEETLLLCLSPARWPTGWPPPAPPLQQGEQRPSDRRCLAAIIGLNKLASVSALSALQAIVDDPAEAEEVRQAAYIAVRTISWKVGSWDEKLPVEQQSRTTGNRQWFTRRQSLPIPLTQPRSTA